MQKVEINVDVGGRGSIKVDGVELPGVYAINVRVRAGELTKVFIAMVADVKIETNVPEVLELRSIEGRSLKERKRG